MADYEGLVAVKKGGQKVEVLIRPSSEGIPGVSERINQQVCHCAADGSMVKIEAVDAAGAEVGDWVLVHRDTAALVRNAVLLVGIPLAGIIVGSIVSYFMTARFTSPNPAGIIVGAAIVISSLLTGILGFKRTYQPAIPVIIRVIRRASEMAFSQEIQAGPQQASPCEACRFTC